MIYRLGVDGGGTKTEAILVDSSGTVVAQRVGPGCNPSVAGPEGAKNAFGALVTELLAPFPSAEADFKIEATLLCMAGNPAFWAEFAASLTTFGRISTVTDAVPVLQLATGGKPGIVLHAGTGSFVAAVTAAPSSALPVPRSLGEGGTTRSTPAALIEQEKVHYTPHALFESGEVHYAGGLGWKFGDPGSGYDIGRRVVVRALLELQGWYPPSALSRFLQEETGLEDAQGISRFYYNDSAANPKIAQLAAGTLELAARGDAVAHPLVLSSMSELLDLAHAVATKLFPHHAARTIPAGLSGPILTHPFVAERLMAMSSLPLKVVTESPIEGVRQLLAKA